jgi:hypothetical protein
MTPIVPIQNEWAMQPGPTTHVALFPILVAWAPGPLLLLSFWRAWFATPRGGGTLVELT